MTQHPLERAIDEICKCVLCGKPMGQCDCWVRCPCGLLHERGKLCRNPACRPAETPQ